MSLAENLARRIVTALAGIPEDQYEECLDHLLDVIMVELLDQRATVKEAEDFATLVSLAVALIELDIASGATLSAPSFC